MSTRSPVDFMVATGRTHMSAVRRTRTTSPTTHTTSRGSFSPWPRATGRTLRILSWWPLTRPRLESEDARGAFPRFPHSSTTALHLKLPVRSIPSSSVATSLPLHATRSSPGLWNVELASARSWASSSCSRTGTTQTWSAMPGPANRRPSASSRRSSSRATTDSTGHRTLRTPNGATGRTEGPSS